MSENQTSEIATAASQTIDVQLPMYGEEENQPTFTVKILRRRQTKQITQVVERMRSLQAAPDAQTPAALDKAFDEVTAAAKTFLVGWTGVKDYEGNDMPFDLEALEDALTERELAELLSMARASSFLTADQRKKSE